MALTLTFKELLDAAGFSGTANTGGEGYDKAKSILTIPAVRNEISQEIQRYWAQNEISALFVNVNDPPLVTDLRSYFVQFLDQTKSNAPSFGSNALLRGNSVRNTVAPGTRTGTDRDISGNVLKNADLKKTDPLLALLIKITDRISLPSRGASSVGSPGVPGARVSPAGASFSFNANNLKINIRDEVVESLNEAELASLGTVGAKFGEHLQVPKSGVMFVDSNIRNQFVNQPYPTYTGIDLQLIFMTPNIISNNVTVKAFSFSQHSGVIPVSTLGKDSPKGFAKGSRTIAGSIICTISVNDPLFDLQPVNYSSKNNYASSSSDIWRTYLLPDQFPLFDILALFTNEYGFASSMVVFGVKITDVGQVISMSDSEIEVTYTYIAMDMDLLRNISYDAQSEDGRQRTYDILADNEYLAKRERAIRGISAHRDISEVPAVFAAIDRRSNEIAFQRLQNRGASLSDVIKIKEVLDGQGNASSGKSKRFIAKDS